MSDTFLPNLMRAVHRITSAARCLALDSELNIQTSVGVTDEELVDTSFLSVVKTSVQQALADNQPVLTNNLITDPTDAPHTNTHLSGLRVIIAVPVENHGAIYLDQSVRDGVFERDTMDNLMALINHLISNEKLHLEHDAMAELYGSV